LHAMQITSATYLTIVCIGIVLSWFIIKKALEAMDRSDDPSEIVLDEVLGCLLAFWAIPLSTPILIVGFIIFRILDITKSFGVGFFEVILGAWGILLDDLAAGAANPWGGGWSADGQKLVIAHAGVNEVSVNDFPMLLEQLPPQAVADDSETNSPAGMAERIDGADNLPFLSGSRQRVKLPAGDLGPRALVVVGHKAYTANYFSDTLSVVDLDAVPPKATSIALGPKVEMSPVRLGEYYFHDGNLCRQGWQSCANCHPDGRADGLNWDLMNDGIDNPKNTRSLLLAHRTPPAMFLGVRANAETAVRSGLRHILFTEQPESVAAAMDEYLKSLQPVPSPRLVDGKLSAAAKRGERTFREAGCADCHVPGLYTDLKAHDVGTRRTFDGPKDMFYTPTLIEAWRTAPYLHDGSAATIRDMLTRRNPNNEHGVTKTLTEQELNDLCEYVLSL